MVCGMLTDRTGIAEEHAALLVGRKHMLKPKSSYGPACRSGWTSCSSGHAWRPGRRSPASGKPSRSAVAMRGHDKAGRQLESHRGLVRPGKGKPCGIHQPRQPGTMACARRLQPEGERTCSAMVAAGVCCGRQQALGSVRETNPLAPAHKATMIRFIHPREMGGRRRSAHQVPRRPRWRHGWVRLSMVGGGEPGALASCQ